MRTQSEIALAHRAGRRLFRSFNKNINVITVAGTAFDMSVLAGNPPAQYYVGGIATATALARSTDGGLDHGPDKPGQKKFLHKVTFQAVTAGAVPMTIELLDYLMFYPFIGMDTGTVECVNSISLPRYSASDGVQMMIVEQNPYTGGSQVRLTYTNQDGVEGRVTPTLTLNSVTNIGSIATSAPTLAGATGDFVPLQSGDYGVDKLDSIEILTGDVGVLCVVLVKPIATFAIYDIAAPSEFELWNHLGYYPRIKDDAYLNFVGKPAGNATGATIHGNLTTTWSE